MEPKLTQSSLRLQNLLPQGLCKYCSSICACVWIIFTSFMFYIYYLYDVFDISKQVLFSIATQLEYVGPLNRPDVIVLKFKNSETPQYAGLLVLHFRRICKIAKSDY